VHEAVSKKKLLIHTLFGSFSVEEQTIWDHRQEKEIRPVVRACAIHSHGYSIRLERALTDFGSDVPFAKVPSKMKEHYGIDVPTSSGRTATLKHAAMCEPQLLPPLPPVKEAVLITEVDGSMIPIVDYPDRQAKDLRKKKTVMWKEAKLCLARAPDRITPTLAVTLGDAQTCGELWRRLAEACGFGKVTRLHCLGDGASWIAHQMETQFGAQARYTIDIFHVYEYLAPVAAQLEDAGKTWMEGQKKSLWASESQSVLNALKPLAAANDPDASATTCLRYLSARIDQLDYARAIAQNLPIGSGEVESAHRYIIQKRLKLPGAWWLSPNAQHILNLRCMRHNNMWNIYWDKKLAA
jgi:hypothetical protein